MDIRCHYAHGKHELRKLHDFHTLLDELIGSCTKLLTRAVAAKLQQTLYKILIDQHAVSATPS